ncbi:MAG TPA: hypothetical protein VGM89_14715 [Puia sp.]
MEFRTRLVVNNKNKRAVVAYIGLAISALSLFMVFFSSLEDYVPWVFGTGVLVVLIGALLAKGRIAVHVLSEEDLVVSVAGIDIGSHHYPLGELSSLDINVEVYAGMLTEAWGMPKDAISDGMGNDLSFRWQGSKVSCRYYLNSRQHTLQLAGVLAEFYERHIPFIERRGSVRTYLLQQLNEAQLAEFKQKYGYA